MTSNHPSGDFDAIPARLRSDVRRLGTLLGRVIADARGQEFVEKIERIRALAKQARSREHHDWSDLTDELSSLSDEEFVDIARAFNQFLNLANLAEQKHGSLYRSQSFKPDWNRLHRLRSQSLKDDLAETRIELVLTAHPTEVLRRTLIRKYDAMVQALYQSDDVDLERLISEAWHTDEIRQTRPTPLDEAQWGFNVLENSLWLTIPKLMRDIDEQLLASGETPLLPTCMPFHFASWMGGDRDGNPNVTAEVTLEIVRVAKHRAATQYVKDIDRLIESLSMSVCNEALAERTQYSTEPYRAVLRDLRLKLNAVLSQSETPSIECETDLLEPLVACYDSLCDSGLSIIARGPLLDTIRRACCFGINLVNLDVRQDAARHTQVFEELTSYFGDTPTAFSSWNENERVTYLLNELESKRPLIPTHWSPSSEVKEALNTFQMVADLAGKGVSNYIISMAKQPSDVLAVAVLLKASGLTNPIQIVPLFETLDDLERAGDMLQTLLSLSAYREYVQGLGDHQQVMIGYSDSAKDAGQFAAAWAQYRAQEALVQVAHAFNVKLTLFHGRGGAIGRGGGPIHEAILAQPPGTVAKSLRLTEQGEMIRFKLGSPDIAFESLARYLFATIEASHTMRSGDDVASRQVVTELAELSMLDYREVVTDSSFVSLFNQLTPEQELADLAIGSRPNRRGMSKKDVRSLRAIPWIFAWTQVRLMVPAWLGTLKVLEEVAEDEQSKSRLLSWSFFRMQMELLEVMLAKVEVSLVHYYASRMSLDGEPKQMLDELLKLYHRSVKTMCRIYDSDELLATQPLVNESLRVRNTYLDPLHLLQAELLARFRNSKKDESSEVEKALKVTMAGIASGLRNTG